MAALGNSEKLGTFVVGARGYSGQQLTRLLLRHPAAKLVGITATDPKWKLSEALPDEAARSVPSFSVDAIEASAKKVGARVVFLATPVPASR